MHGRRIRKAITKKSKDNELKNEKSKESKESKEGNNTPNSSKSKTTIIMEFSDPDVKEFFSNTQFDKKIQAEFKSYSMKDLRKITKEDLQEIVGGNTASTLHKLLNPQTSAVIQPK